MQGAFILVGNNSFGYPLLIVMAIGVFTYTAWRFWEGITGQGSDDAFGPFKNFFRYRLSPLVSVSASFTPEQLSCASHRAANSRYFRLYCCCCFVLVAPQTSWMHTVAVSCQACIPQIEALL